MFGGLLKSTSLAALVAVAGVAVSGVSAQAADLGGNCCADLEERIAELEATTARKGNRKVSLTVSGIVNEGILFFDDGVESNAYVATNERERSRFRFLGTAKINSDWTAGYLMEIGVRGNRLNQLSQDISATGKGLDVRHSAFWLQHKDLGKLWLGQTSEATDGITEVNLAGTNHFAHAQLDDYIGGFKVRNSATGVQSTNSIANITGIGSGGNNPGEGTRFNVVKYETPTLAGFIGSASFGEDDLWDVALRYAGEFSGVKLAAGIGYTSWHDNNKVVNAVGVAGSSNRNCARAAGTNASCDELGLSASIMHVPTGLYLSGSYGTRDEDHRIAVLGPNARKKDEFYYVQGGIEQAFFPLGKSTFFGEYFDGRFGGAINSTGNVSVGRTDAGLGFGAANIGTSEVNYWGIGFNQNITAAVMDIYVSYRNYEFDVKSTAGVKAQVEDIQTIFTGARIQF